MKHPENLEWMAYVYGELDPAGNRELDAHLGECPECARRVERWRRTIADLDTAREPVHRARAAGGFRWLMRAAAAALVMATGFGLGRLGRVSEVELRERLAAWRGEVAREFSARRESEWIELTEATVRRVREENTRLLEGFAAEYRRARFEDRRDLWQAMEVVDQRTAMEAARLERGLITLASSTGNGFEEAQTRMRWLATNLAGGGLSEGSERDESGSEGDQDRRKDGARRP